MRASTYPGIVHTGSYGGVADYYGIEDGAGTWIAFSVLDAKVTAISVGPHSAMAHEHCPA